MLGLVALPRRHLGPAVCATHTSSPHLQIMPQPTGYAQRHIWEPYLNNYDEGLGLVYERFILNDFLLDLKQQADLRTVLEAPIYGMAGVTGINSIPLARAGCRVILVDDMAERAEAVRRIWNELQAHPDILTIDPDQWGALPLPDNSVDLAWNWAALWYLPDAAALLRELARVSRHLVFVAMPNNLQVGYWLRKLILDREFFPTVDERWVNLGRIRRTLEGAGVRILTTGVLDVPPWPDTVMPAGEVLKRLGIRSKRLERQFTGENWSWSTMAYYTGRQPDLRDRVMRYAWLDRARLPWQLKAIWAHHRWLLGEVQR
ncbi:MAG: class I SAM-dependent methyltransferase [Caldilineae bacterium]|nr:MAG: class I SAM-dependent methyltransferase [Caldilineae bacterium]